MALWISVLFALIGGEVPAIRNVGQRLVSLLAATYLLAILLIWVVPHLFDRGEFSPLFEAAVRYGPLAPLATIFLVTAERAPRADSYGVDLIYSVLLFLMVVVLVLGAFVIRQLSHGNYVLALAQALLVIAGILLALSWLWDPRAGFAGIGQVMNRYFMSVGMPFERWMHSLANLADQERDPDKFVMTAAEDMAALPWVSGIDWQTATQRGMSGHITRHATECRLGPLRLTVYTRWSPEPDPGAAHPPARASAGRLLRGQGARAGAAPQRIHARHLRNRLAPDSRCEESAAIAALIVCRRRQQRRSRRAGAAPPAAPAASAGRPAPADHAGQARPRGRSGPHHASPPGIGGASCRRATRTSASCSSPTRCRWS